MFASDAHPEVFAVEGIQCFKVSEDDTTHFFASLNGHRPAQLYDMVLREVEEPLFKAVLDYVEGNQSRAAGILGINRGTLRKKLRQFGLSA